MEVEEYLKRKGIGYEKLSEAERKAISNFALLWTLFEAQLLDENASAIKIVQKSKDWINLYGVDYDVVEGHLKYFKNRYIENGAVGYRFSHLNLRRNDSEQLVKDVLLGNNNEIEDKLACCLVIILRFRNNFFHGIKWAYQFREQQDNFERSCFLLSWCLERYVK